MWRGDAMAVTFHMKPHFWHSTPPHLRDFNTTSSHITWRDVELCGVEFQVMCGMFCKVAVMWIKVRCRICTIWCDAKRVQCQMCCEMWRYDVEWWCGTRGIWYADVKCARCEMWLCNTEWCGMVWHHIRQVVWLMRNLMVEIQCGMCAVG